MVSESYDYNVKRSICQVLILVVVEDGLGDAIQVRATSWGTVLILVVVEDGLEGKQYKCIGLKEVVLILVVVEDGLGELPLW